MATVVLGIAAAGVMLPFTSGAKIRAEGERRTLAAKLASDLIEEIISIEFGEVKFEEVITQYGAYTELQGHIIKNFDTGTEFTGPAYANFSRGSSCAYDVSQPFFIIATVWVKHNGNEIMNLNRLISR